jgi:hypothetical protein
MRTKLFCLMLVFAALAANGASGQQTYTAIGAGNSSCGAWTMERRPPYDGAALNTQWVVGFLSGVGFMGKSEGVDPLRGVVDPNAVVAWIDNWCSSHPLNSIAEAAAAFRYEHPNAQ